MENKNKIITVDKIMKSKRKTFKTAEAEIDYKKTVNIRKINGILVI